MRLSRKFVFCVARTFVTVRNFHDELLARVRDIHGETHLTKTIPCRSPINSSAHKTSRQYIIIHQSYQTCSRVSNRAAGSFTIMYLPYCTGPCRWVIIEIHKVFLLEWVNSHHTSKLSWIMKLSEFTLMYGSCDLIRPIRNDCDVYACITHLTYHAYGSTVVYWFVLSTHNQRVVGSIPTRCVCP